MLKVNEENKTYKGEYGNISGKFLITNNHLEFHTRLNKSIILNHDDILLVQKIQNDHSLIIRHKDKNNNFFGMYKSYMHLDKNYYELFIKDLLSKIGYNKLINEGDSKSYIEALLLCIYIVVIIFFMLLYSI